MRYCEAITGSGLGQNVNTYFFCDWNGQLYTSANDCFNSCSSLLISKSDASFIVILIVSLFVLFLVSWIAKAILE
jgi:hypothetical protein